MANPEPRGGQRRLLIGMGVIALAAGAAIILLRDGGQERPAARPEPATDARPPTPAAAAPPATSAASPPTLDRAGLLAAAEAAASAYAAGEDVAAPDLLGRRFSVRIAFGCAGASPPETGGAASWSLGPEGRTLRVSVRPELWTDSPFAQALGGPGVEAVEGFWIPRPWTTSEGCPAQRADPLLAEAPPPSPQTVGLASVFTEDSSRLGRPGEGGYTLTRPLDGTSPPGPQGLRLVLEGRVTGFPDGRAAACRSASPDQRPVCLIGVEMERIAVRDPARDELLGEWRTAPALSVPTSPPASAPAAPAG